MVSISTHVLDTATGRPGAGMTVRLESRSGDWLGEKVTNDDGRVDSNWEQLVPGDYVLRFDTGGYWSSGTASTPRSSSCSPSPTTVTTTCRCCSRRTATRPTVAADLLIRARRAIVDGAGRAVCVGIEDGRIVAVTAYDDQPAAARTVDLADDEVLLPGLVDTHVHVNEPGRTEWEGFASATLAAAAGGVTTILDMPLNSIPPTTTVAALEVKREVAEGQCFVDVGFWGGAVPGNLADLEALHEAGVFGFKCFLLDSGVAEFPHLPPTRSRPRWPRPPGSAR